MKKALAVLLLLLAAGGAWWVKRPSLHQQGLRQMERGDLDGALATFQRALEKTTWAPEAEEEMRNEMARAYLMKGALDNAEDVLKSTLDKFPESAYAHLARGFIFLSKGFDAYAVESFAQAARGDPKDARPRLGLGGLYAFRGEFDRARQEYEAALAGAPGDRGALLGLAHVHALCGRYPESIAAYESALQSMPQDARARLALARALLLSGDAASAEAAARNALERDPASVPGRVLLGDILRETGRGEEAGAAYAALVAEDERNLLPLLRLALWRARRGELDQARSLLDKAAQVLPKPETGVPSFASLAEVEDALERRSYLRQAALEHALAWHRFYAMQGLVADAEREVQRALQIHSKDMASLRAMTEIARLRGDAEGRLAWAGRALEAAPDHCLALLDRAEARLSAGMAKDAVADARHAEDACPALPRAPAVLAHAYLAAGKGAEAAAAAASAAQRGDTPDSYIALGAVALAAKRWDEAEKEFRRALDMDPYLARAHYELGRALAAAKKPSSQASFREAARLEPAVYGFAAKQASR